MPSKQDQRDGWVPAGDVGHLVEVGQQDRFLLGAQGENDNPICPTVLV